MLEIKRLALASTCLLAISFAHSHAQETGTKRPAPIHEAFDRGYGRLPWNDEKARLDNFAIQLLNEPDYIGYIFVFNAPGMCPGEAHARGVRAKRYMVEHRGVPWNRVIWKEEGFRTELETTLWLFRRDEAIPYHFFSNNPPWAKLQEKDCKARLAQIKRSKGN